VVVLARHALDRRSWRLGQRRLAGLLTVRIGYIRSACKRGLLRIGRNSWRLSTETSAVHESSKFRRGTSGPIKVLIAWG
jgi:hypothetical protein